MPKDLIDYSNTIIYKIYCKDYNIHEIYVGHTTNYIKRKYQHKMSCNNLNNKVKIYDIIRANGGWDNWEMVEIAKYNCKDSTEARIKEQHHYELLKASLNSVPPFIDKEQYFCNTCNVQCSSTKDYEKHFTCNLHAKKEDYKIITNTDISGNTLKQNSIAKYCCKICNYNTDRKSNLNNHLNSAKHLKEINASIFKQKLSNTFECDNCAKIFQTNSGLWKHKSKGCAINNENKDYDKSSDTLISKELITMLIKDNSELKHMMMEVIKNVGHNTTNTNINSHNKSFNLNFFLNETCKNAMNITDFVDSLKLQLSDLERVGELGYIEGISSIIINNLKELDVTLRPVHCTDKKRETIYIKDENKWEKDEENKKMHKLVRKVADKNARLLPKFKEKYPDYKKSSSKVSDQFNKILIESMGGAGDNDFEKEEKIIKRVSKEVTVEKS
jgi:hypothetical protein